MKPSEAVKWHMSFMRALVVVVGMALLSAGCVGSPKIRVTPTAKIQDVPGPKIPLNVGLMLDTNFCAYKAGWSPRGAKWGLELGLALQQQSASLCEQTFRQVMIATNGVVPAGVDAVLTPEAHRCGIAILGNTYVLTLLEQWTLRTADNRETIWMMTTDGQATGPEKKVFQMLFDDLASKTYRAFEESPEIRRLSSGKTGAGGM